MPTTLIDDPEWIDVEVPAGGDPVSRAAIVAAIATLTNRTRWLMERLGLADFERRMIVPASAFGIGDGASLVYGPSYGIAGPSVELVAGGIADLPLSVLLPAGTRIASVRVLGFAGASGDELKVQRIVYPIDPASGDAPGYTEDWLTVTGVTGAFDETWTHVGAYETIPWYNGDVVFGANRGATILRLAADAGNVSGTAVHGLDITFEWPSA